MNRIAIFASGQGSNAETILKDFKDHSNIRIAMICSDKKEPGVKAIARSFEVPFVYLPSGKRNDEEYLLNLLRTYSIDFIVLAGYLKLIPSFLLRKYPNKIINIHPSLLPRFGGKGMYGKYVHQAVKDAGVSETGITIHLVNMEYDKGRILFQKSIPVDVHDSIETIESKVRKLEHQYFSKVIEQWVTSSYSF